MCSVARHLQYQCGKPDENDTHNVRPQTRSKSRFRRLGIYITLTKVAPHLLHVQRALSCVFQKIDGDEADTMSNAKAPAKILMVLHQERSTPGRVGVILRSFGFNLDIRRPSLGSALPRGLDEHAGVVVFGGPMCANDNFDWLRREIDWLARPLRDHKPILGLCLGAQLLARQLGSSVYTFDDRRGELGYHHLRPTAVGDAICAVPFPRKAYQWHFDGFDLPRGAHCLAEGSADFPNQAYLYGRNAIGLQFHPEVTYQMICRWTARNTDRLAILNGQRRYDQLDGWFQYDQSVERWLSCFLRQWVSDKLGINLKTSDVPPFAIAAE